MLHLFARGSVHIKGRRVRTTGCWRAMHGRIARAVQELGLERGHIYWFGDRLWFRGVRDADRQRIRNVFSAEGFM